MEANKEEAERCIELAEKHIKENNHDKAEKLLLKAECLYPSQKARDLTLLIQNQAPDFTAAQLEVVTRINKCKDYYEMLGVSKAATDSDIKQAYKKLALLLHPDKNKAPGSAEAFKAIGNALAVLTDAEKRKHYDMFGLDGSRRQIQESQQTIIIDIHPVLFFNLLMNHFNVKPAPTRYQRFVRKTKYYLRKIFKRRCY